MSLFARKPLRIVLLAMLALTASLASAQAVWACEAVDSYGEPRDCTFLERYGECLWNVLDAHDQCMEKKESFLDGVRCQAGTQVDLFACNLGIPFKFIGTVLNPFG